MRWQLWQHAAWLALALYSVSGAQAQPRPEEPPPRREDAPPPRREDPPARREDPRGAERRPMAVVAPGGAREEAGARLSIRLGAGGPWLGLECQPLPPPLRAQVDLPEEEGLLVREIVPNGPADTAGVKQFDILATVNGKPLKQVSDLVDAVTAAGEQKIKLSLRRGGKSLEIEVAPAARTGNVVYGIAEDGPIRLQFAHPGMMLPPGLTMRPPFPDDLKLTLTKQGNAPAKIEVHRGEASWTVTEDELDKLPDAVRAPVQGLLGRLPISDMLRARPTTIALPSTEAEGGPRATTAQAMPIMAERIGRQLREMSQRIEELRGEVNELRGDRRPPRGGETREGPNRERPDRERGGQRLERARIERGGPPQGNPPADRDPPRRPRPPREEEEEDDND